jgi:hypothetical protein
MNVSVVFWCYDEGSLFHGSLFYLSLFLVPVLLVPICRSLVPYMLSPL